MSSEHENPFVLERLGLKSVIVPARLEYWPELGMVYIHLQGRYRLPTDASNASTDVVLYSDADGRPVGLFYKVNTLHSLVLDRLLKEEGQEARQSQTGHE